MVREGEETTADTEVVMGEGMVTGSVIVEGEVVTTDTVVGVDKEEVTTGAAAFANLVAWYRAARNAIIRYNPII